MTSCLSVLAVNDTGSSASRLLGPGADVRTASQVGTPDIRLSYRPGDFPELQAVVEDAGRDGWSPDVVLVMNPEFFPIPDGTFSAALPVAAYVGDWHLAFSRLIRHLPLYDAILTDGVGARAFGARGVTNCRVIPVYDCAPEFVRSPEDIALRPVDIGFVGNLARLIQYERARWIDRLARMADRGVTVRIGFGITGDRYADFLSSCKIGFNRSIRSEFNIRAYETLACGSVLLAERGNVELAGALTDGVEYVTYDDDFEDVVLGLLADEERLAEIASSGHRWFLAQQEDDVRQHAASDALADVACGRSGRPRRAGHLGDLAAVFDQQTWFETHDFAPDNLPPSRSVSELIESHAAVRPEIAGSVATRLAKGLVLLLSQGRQPGDPEIAPFCTLVSTLYEAASAGGSLVAPMNDMALKHYCGLYANVVSAARCLVPEIDACSDPCRLEGVLLASTQSYAVEYLVREKILASYGTLPTEKYLEDLGAVSRGIVLLLQGDAEHHMGIPQAAITSWVAADASFPVDIMVASQRIANVTFAIAGTSLVPGRALDATESTYTQLFVSAAERIVAESIFDAEPTMVNLARAYLALGRDDDAASLAHRYESATACFVGDAYRNVARGALGQMRSIAVEFGRRPSW